MNHLMMIVESYDKLPCVTSAWFGGIPQHPKHFVDFLPLEHYPAGCEITPMRNEQGSYGYYNAEKGLFTPRVRAFGSEKVPATPRIEKALAENQVVDGEFEKEFETAPDQKYEQTDVPEEVRNAVIDVRKRRGGGALT